MEKNLKESGLSLFELGQSLGLAPPSHGYTIAEKSPEIVTAPGVYFPIKRGRVIPLKPKADGGKVESVNPKTTMMQNMFDEKLIMGPEPKPVPPPLPNVPLAKPVEKPFEPFMPYFEGEKGIPGPSGVAKEWTGPRPFSKKNVPLVSRQFGGAVEPLKEFEDTGINYSLNSGIPTQQRIEATANTALLQPTPINIAPSPISQPVANAPQPTAIPPSQPLTVMGENEYNVNRMRENPTPTPKFSLGNINPLTAFAPRRFRENRSSPMFASDQKTAFDKKWKPYNDLMASITGGIPLAPRAKGGITDPSMTEEDLKRLKEAFPDTITSHEPTVIGAENLVSNAPVAQNQGTEGAMTEERMGGTVQVSKPEFKEFPKKEKLVVTPQGNLVDNAPATQDPFIQPTGIPTGIKDIRTCLDYTQEQTDQLAGQNKPAVQPPTVPEDVKKETAPKTPTLEDIGGITKETLPSGETKYTLPGTEGTATVEPQAEYLKRVGGPEGAARADKTMRDRWAAEAASTPEGMELAEREKWATPGYAEARLAEVRKQLGPNVIKVSPGYEKSYYSAHPEEEEAERIRQQNQPMIDTYIKLIEEAKNRAGGFGLMGLSPRRAREVQTASIAALPQLTQGLEKLRSTPEKGAQITPHITKDAQGNQFFTYPPTRGRGVVNVPIGMGGKISQTPYKIGERQKFIGKGGKEYEGTFLGLNPNNEPEWGNVEPIAEKPTAEKGGQNWMLPSGSSVISYDGGRTYAMPDGQIKPMPPTAVKVPGGATLSEIKIEKAKEQARLELERVQGPSKPSPKEAALTGTGPYKKMASAFEAVAGGLGLDLLIGEKGLFPDMADAKQYLRSVKQMGKAALMNSSRGAIWEQQKIEELFPNPDTLFTNPRIEARKFENLLNVLAIEKAFNNQAILDAFTPKEIEKYRNSNNEINRLISFVSEPKRGKGLTDEEKALIEKYRKK